MPLRITLKPLERLIINGAAIRNGDRSCSFVVETQCRFLRESEIVYESEADTPCKQLCLTVQVIHLAEDTTETENLFYAQASAVLAYMPSSAPYLLEMQRAIEEKQTYAAIKAGKLLIMHEAEVLAERGASNAA
ncbi:flagellar biosynthesis repressor FlbT [Methylobacterium sp. SD21]|uniref:flagellar biosynthesis repressor FlbT n=1 Tax=Methylobacterium litchii TaxID=3138810 RepID=UPI00313ED484